jgi:hypothetical protein
MNPVTKVLKRWTDIHKHVRDGWAFRGQECADYRLATALERLQDRIGVQFNRASDLESVLLREFRRRYHHYSPHPPMSDHDLEWLSIMQHHGAPTRLLDWTYSIYVAGYFALESAQGDSAIWALDYEWIRAQARKMLKDRDPTATYTTPERATEADMPMFRNVFMTPPFKGMVAAINPFRLTERLTIQKGFFLCPGDISIPFEENLTQMKGWREHVVKVVVRKSARREGLRSLFQMNTDRSTLFPGLDGFARSLSVFHPLVDQL